jgi:hypothetical protein
MRICITGTTSQGKSTLIDDFLTEWTTYTTPEKTYRDKLKNKWGIKTTKDTQWDILNSIVDETQKYDSEDRVVFDRGPLDNLACSMWAYSKNIKGIDDKFIEKSMAIVRESLKLIDIIFYVPLTRASSTLDHRTEKFKKNEKKGLVSDDYRVEIDNILKAIKRDWDTNPESKFFDTHDKPAVIEVFGEPLERIQIMKYYLDVDGDAIDDTGILSAEELNEIEDVKSQFGISDSTTQALKNPKGY